MGQPGNPVVTAGNFQLPGGIPPLTNDEVVVFTVPAFVTARIESLYAQALYESANINDFWVLRVYTAAGPCVFAASTGFADQD